ncbi:hypothetical protein [Abyssalbus ytuae]|uniref:Uncharacterized protein n=1 Tax=Abyssalbus ytuae TaxID=2926907 RepID=A0A9E6ZT03_9FLAO|nr:hypothetical protein [Abyssalbus ytuae]UOB16141.1 hypothetical protein MQE35_10370 [Abyssalbus ytuae]
MQADRMKIATEKQLEFIKSKHGELMKNHVKKHVWEGNDPAMLENFIFFTHDDLFGILQKENYLLMTKCQKIWNEYFWYLRCSVNVELNGGTVSDHEQALFNTLEKLYYNCEQIDDELVEPFICFSENFVNQAQIIFDYFLPVVPRQEASLNSKEFRSIIQLLKIRNFTVSEVDELIEKNINNPGGELLIYSGEKDKGTVLKIDTFTKDKDRIPVINLLIKCPVQYYKQVDELLVMLWGKFSNTRVPFVGMLIVDKFEEEYYHQRKKIVK